MNKFKIPSSFELFGSTWKVIQANKELNDQSKYGDCDYSAKVIRLAETVMLDKLAKDKINQTYCHELVHAILDSLGEHELSSNEKLVNMFGELLYQHFKSAKYE